MNRQHEGTLEMPMPLRRTRPVAVAALALALLVASGGDVVLADRDETGGSSRAGVTLHEYPNEYPAGNPTDDVWPPSAVDSRADFADWMDEVLQDVWKDMPDGAPAAGPDQGLDQGQDQEFAAVEACMVREMRDNGIAGASMAIAVDGELAHARAFGVKSKTEGGPVDTETMFRINSTTKMMTAAAVMQQVEAGRLDLNAPITEYAPEFSLRAPWQADQLTLHSLLTHSAAAPDPYFDYARFPVSYDMPDPSLTVSEWAARLSRMHLYAPPGSFWNYGNPNFSLAALPVEHVTGRWYGEYVTNELWRPAGMEVTTFDAGAVVASGNYSFGHNGSQPYDPGDYDRVYAWPAGGAYSTPTDLIKWAQVFLNDGGDVLSPESVRAMTTQHVPAQAVPWSQLSSYGYGVFADEYRSTGRDGDDVIVYNHPGNGRGYSTEFYWIPDRGFAIAILMNEYSSMRGTVQCALREIEELAIAPVRGLDTPFSAWDRYTGTYGIVDPYGDLWTARVARGRREMTIEYTDWSIAPAIADAVDPARMSLQFLDTFRYGGYGDATVTFEDRAQEDENARWMRSRYFVGQRVGELPASLQLQGSDCTPLALTSGLDAPDLKVRAYGLSETLSLRNQPISQDDPDDPTSARIRIDLVPRGDVGFFTAWLFEDGDDNLELYLLQDQNGDGEYSWPDELVDRLTTTGAQGMLVAARDTEGPYQLWVHGATVNGGGSRYSLDVVMVSGDDLLLDGEPTAVADGQSVTFDVCGPAGQPYASSRVGIVELDFGVPSSVVRVPVYWSPRVVPTTPPTPTATRTPRPTLTPSPEPPVKWPVLLPMVLKGR